MCNRFSKNLGLGEGSALPVGVPVPWPSATPPSGWLKCNGAAFTASQYPKLALAYPALKLPDLRGEFLRGWDDGRGIDAGREILTAQGGTLVGFDPVRSDDGLVGVPGVDGANYAAIQGDKLPASVDSVSHLWTALAAGAVNRRAIGYDTAVISRPRNIAFNYIVRAA
ncbi:TPA: tail fiber protein [Escherichia coli]|nr:tail fiber protein [Escherichia coli]